MRNSSTSSSIASESPTHPMLSMPSSSTKRAPGIASATARPAATGTSASSRRCMTRVGAWIRGSASVMSEASEMRRMSRAPRGETE